MTKIPAPRVKAAMASFDVLVLGGRAALRMRRTQATGGSNSTVAEGPAAVVVAVDVAALLDSPGDELILNEWCVVGIERSEDSEGREATIEQHSECAQVE